MENKELYKFLPENENINNYDIEIEKISDSLSFIYFYKKIGNLKDLYMMVANGPQSYTTVTSNMTNKFTALPGEELSKVSTITYTVEYRHHDFPKVIVGQREIRGLVYDYNHAIIGSDVIKYEWNSNYRNDGLHSLNDHDNTSAETIEKYLNRFDTDAGMLSNSLILKYINKKRECVIEQPKVYKKEVTR